MLNFRQLKKDIAPSTLKEGKFLFDKKCVTTIAVEKLTPQTLQLKCSVVGAYEKTFSCQMEIDRKESMAVDADCSCPDQFDCQHLAAVLFHLEENLDKLIVSYSKEGKQTLKVNRKEAAALEKEIQEAEKKVAQQKEEQLEKELLEEYLEASEVLGRSPFFHQEQESPQQNADLVLILQENRGEEGGALIDYEFSLSLRLPIRSKPLSIPNIREFLEAVRYEEPLFLGNRRYFFTLDSFDDITRRILKRLFYFVRLSDPKDEKGQKIARLDSSSLGTILGDVFTCASGKISSLASVEEEHSQIMPCIFMGGADQPLGFSRTPVQFEIALEVIESPESKILLNPKLRLAKESLIPIEQATLYPCARPGILHQGIYYRFARQIKRSHLLKLQRLRDVTIPEPLFGTFIEISIPQLMYFARVDHQDILDQFVTLPFAGKVQAECMISYLDGELEASLEFLYDKNRVPAAPSKITLKDLKPFVKKEGVLARNLTEEREIIEELFRDFFYDVQAGIFSTKSERKIIEFMTEVIPHNQQRITFHCPENLLEQFIYDETTFELSLKESSKMDVFEAELKVNGSLQGLTLDQIWECLATKRSYIPLAKKKGGRRKILVLDLERLSPIAQIFDEIGLHTLDNHKEERPLWALASLDEKQFEGLPIAFSMSKKLKDLQQQMLGNKVHKPGKIPDEIKASLRSYQIEGVHWLQQLRTMHLNGILADDMGLGKTLQAIIAITQKKKVDEDALTIVVCPTSLLYNWEEEIGKFNPYLKALVIDGTPAQRQKLIKDAKTTDVLITSYSLLQKDIELYEKINFSYSILDEAQHIKNRATRNAKSVKRLNAAHRLILTGTPIENSLEELWSLFDFLMPGLLSTYDRFVEKYIRNPAQSNQEKMQALKRKCAPFILRRMKQEVLKDLPAVAEIVYHCHLSDVQKELYHSYAESARKELAQLVQKEGFDRVQIHVLATLTRLKQICCHPAIFAKEKSEEGDSAKYEMLKELLQNLIDGGHKTVIFSQYTKMLKIMNEDLKQQGIPFCYLDGSSKNRLSIVKQFNEDRTIPIFLVSLKAGGSGLNLTGADTVIHYDMWWNPAVESQATDRVHRIGQESSVSSYKLVTKGTIEEKIIAMQDRKRGLVKSVINCDEEAISKLTWEEVLELLQT